MHSVYSMLTTVTLKQRNLSSGKPSVSDKNFYFAIIHPQPFSICSTPLIPPTSLRRPTWVFSSFTWARWLPCFAFAADQLGILADFTLWHLSGWHRKLTWRWLDMPSGRHLRSLPWRPLLLSHLLVNVLCCWKQWQLLGVVCIYASLWLDITFLSLSCFCCF